MACFDVGIPQKLRQCFGSCTIEKGARAANGDGLDLVGRSNKFRKPGEGKTPPPKDRRDRR
jgi:hypothetical protein